MYKKLIIVCDEKMRKYGDFLAQLISLEDDKEDEVVGVKDGFVAAQVWLEKDYEVNSHLLSSDQYILFLGNSKLAKDKRLHMKTKYSEFGMEYGWLGRQAGLCVSASLNSEEYESFVDYAKRYSSDIKLLVEKREERVAIIQASENKSFRNKLADSLKEASASLANVSSKGATTISMLTNSKKIEDQQYSCAVVLFYLNGLSDFLGIKE